MAMAVMASSSALCTLGAPAPAAGMMDKTSGKASHFTGNFMFSLRLFETGHFSIADEWHCNRTLNAP